MERALTTPADRRFRRGGHPRAGEPRAAPRLRRHGASGRAFVRRRTGGRDVCRYFGAWGTQEAKDGYRRFAVEWAAGSADADGPAAADLGVGELIVRRLRWAELEYVKGGKPTSEMHCQRAALRVRYVCGLTGGLAGLGAPLRNQAAQVGMDRARRWVAISDGGAGVEDWLRENFPRAEAVILDFYHAAEHPGGWAKALHPDEAEASRAAGAWCHRLKHEGGRAVLADLAAIDVSGRSEAAREAHRGLLVYFGNQAHRMDYPSYRAKGWLIGSGPVEAACKQVVGQRLKGSGMR